MLFVGNKTGSPGAQATSGVDTPTPQSGGNGGSNALAQDAFETSGSSPQLDADVQRFQFLAQNHASPRELGAALAKVQGDLRQVNQQIGDQNTLGADRARSEVGYLLNLIQEPVEGLSTDVVSPPPAQLMSFVNQLSSGVSTLNKDFPGQSAPAPTSMPLPAQLRLQTLGLEVLTGFGAPPQAVASVLQTMQGSLQQVSSQIGDRNDSAADRGRSEVAYLSQIVDSQLSALRSGAGDSLELSSAVQQIARGVGTLNSDFYGIAQTGPVNSFAFPRVIQG
jgi:hypothetical protein